jgi:hypothetical protein
MAGQMTCGSSLAACEPHLDQASRRLSAAADSDSVASGSKQSRYSSETDGPSGGEGGGGGFEGAAPPGGASASAAVAVFGRFLPPPPPAGPGGDASSSPRALAAGRGLAGRPDLGGFARFFAMAVGKEERAAAAG